LIVEVVKQMRIVIDLQGAQTASRFRGIGRYSLSLAKAMIRNGADHEFYIVLNGLFPETLDSLRAEFKGLVPSEKIRVWDASGPVHAMDYGSDWRRQAAELVREAFIQSLKPDFVHVSSMMEGFGDNGVHSIGRAPHPFPVAVTFYDVIPLIQREVYLDTNPIFQKPYYEKLDYLERADLLFAISESSRQEAIEHLYASPDAVVNIGAAADAGFRVVSVPDEFKRSMYEKFGINREFIMYSGATDERKNHLGLIKAYFVLPESIRCRYQLVLVGGLPADHKARFRAFSRELLGAGNDVVITDRVTDEELVAFYNLCALYVFPSWHEGFGLPALEAMACGAPVIGSETTSIPEVLGRDDVLFDPHSPHSIATKIDQVLADSALLQDLREHGLKQAGLFSWDISARKALAAMDEWHKNNGAYFRRLNDHVTADFPPRWLFPKISRLPGFAAHQADWAVVQDRMAHSRWRDTRYLFVDVSELAQRDGRSGIQRVVRAVLKALFRNPPAGFRVMPVYATTDCLGYRYASDLWRQYNPEEWIPEGFIDFCASDVFFGLDMQHHVIPYQRAFFDILRKFGVKIHFHIYDLLPVLSPEYFPSATYDDHRRWLQVLAEISDGLVCISRTVAEELDQWLMVHPPVRPVSPEVGWSHIGADLLQSAPIMGLPDNAERVLKAVGGSVSFLSVSTIEPRKGHAQLLDAADVLWRKGKDICLVFVGKPGWNVDALVERIEGHKYFGEQLFWLKGISDEYLDLLYQEASCLVSSSFGEGFGLPIVEAALKNMPLIVRDIPVFREVAGDGAVYFSGTQPEDLAAVMETWLEDHEAGRSLPPRGVQVLDWDQSTKRLMEVVLGVN
jgi:glycosyltransferase involved in cell wall biosynthesis